MTKAVEPAVDEVVFGMFQRDVRKTGVQRALSLLEVIFHAAVRNIRKSHGNAVLGLALNIFQTILMILIIYLMMDLLGMRGNALRGDFLLYIMSGVMMFMTHSKTLKAVAGAEGPTSPMMLHAPMNPIVSIAAAALGALYLQALSVGFILFFYHAAITPITIDQPVGALAMMLLSWGSGIGIGMIFLAARPWAPDVVQIATMVYRRANVIASGKMFVANTMPTSTLAYFDWNPLFHTVDQGRGFIFLNYNPHYSSPTYPIYVTLACVLVGLMAEFYTRRHASVSWGAGK